VLVSDLKEEAPEIRKLTVASKPVDSSEISSEISRINPDSRITARAEKKNFYI